MEVPSAHKTTNIDIRSRISHLIVRIDHSDDVFGALGALKWQQTKPDSVSLDPRETGSDGFLHDISELPSEGQLTCAWELCCLNQEASTANARVCQAYGDTGLRDAFIKHTVDLFVAQGLLDNGIVHSNLLELIGILRDCESIGNHSADRAYSSLEITNTTLRCVLSNYTA